MLPWHQDRRRDRRLRVALCLSVGLHFLLALLPFSRFLGRQGGRTDGSQASLHGSTRFAAGALLAAEVQVLQLMTLPDPATSQPSPEPLSEPLPVAEAVPAPEPTKAAQEAAQSLSGSDEGTANPGASAGSGDPSPTPGNEGMGDDDGPPPPPLEAAIRPRIYVYPRVPEEIVRKRKIDDFVLLQVLVGPDGHVREVRVLRSIPNCPECTTSAVDSARRSIYEPYVLHGQPVEVWSLPFPLHFSDHR